MELNEELKVFTGRANPQLAQRITEYLGIKLGDMEISSFSDGETYVRINENIRGRDVFLILIMVMPVRIEKIDPGFQLLLNLLLI